MMQSREGEINSQLGQNVQQNIELPNLTLSLNITPNAPLQVQHPAAFEKKQLFGCRNCTRVFFSSQALGGHMNAHRKDTSKAASKKCGCSIHKKKQPRKTAAFLLSGLSGHVDSCASSRSNPGQEKTKDEPILCDESEIRVPYMHEAGGAEFAQDSDDQLDLNLRL